MAHCRDGARVVQECKLHRKFVDFHKLLVEIEFIKITNFDFAVGRDE